jgi:hypothetical protein
MYRHMDRPYCVMKLRRVEDGSKSPCILKAEACVILIRTCCGNPEDPSQIRRLDADRLSASVGQETNTWAHDPHVLTVRYAEQVQGLDQGQAVRHLQGQGFCNRSPPSLIWNVRYDGRVLVRSVSYRAEPDLKMLNTIYPSIHPCVRAHRYYQHIITSVYLCLPLASS